MILRVLLHIAFCAIAVYLAIGQRHVKYDCTLAEISPDFPKEVKEQCRKERMQK